MERFALSRLPLAGLYEAPREADGDRTLLADELPYGTPVRLLERQGDCFRVLTFYGYPGFVRASALLALSSAEEDALFSALRLVVRPAADVLALPSVHGAVRLTVPGGSLLPFVREAENGWSEVRLLSGEAGYVPSVFLEKPRFALPFLSVPAREAEAFAAKAALRAAGTKGGSGFDLPRHLAAFFGGSEEAFRACLVSSACAFLRAPYRWGGRTPWGIDCSGLVFSAYLRAGIPVYRDAALADGFPLERIEGAFGAEGALRESALTDGTLLPGDALFFPGHVGLFLGEGRFVHSTAKAGSNGVVVSSLLPGAPDFREDLRRSITAAGGLRV